MPAVLAEPEVVGREAPPEVKIGGPGGGGPRGDEPGGDGWGGGDDDEWARRHSRKGPSMGMVGMLATMFSITALFATIVIAYVVRSQTQSHWQPVRLPSLLWFSTALIVLSSATLELARRAFQHYRAHSYARWLTITFFLGLGFILLQALSLRQLVSQGVYLRRNPHSSLFYIITAAHGVHVFGGMLALFYMIYRSSLGAKSVREDFRRQWNLVSVTTVYWHYLDALWVALFTLLVLWK